MKIRVLHIIKSLGRGGAEMLLPETLKLHNQEKYEFHYIYFLPWKNQMVDALEQNGGKVSCFSASNNVLIMLKTGAVINYIKKYDIQMVHCHLPWAGFLGRVVYKLSQVPVVYTEHNKQERYHGITSFLNKFTFNWQSKAIAVSQDVQESIIKNIRPQISIQTILNGVNTETFKRDDASGQELRKKYNIPENALLIGTVAVFRFQKRLVEWLEVMKIVCGQDPNVYGIIVGDGPLKEDIIAKRNELKLENRVLLAGLQTEVKPYLSAMDVYMMTSVFEGLPIAMLEAMSMECAIVSTDAGGIKEVIRDQEDGLIVAVDDWKKLPALLDDLKDSKRRLYFGKQARTRVESSFSLKQMVDALESLYEEISRRK